MSPVNQDDRSKSKNFIRNKLRTLFETAQEQSGHQGLADKCKKLYQKYGDTELFLDEFITILRYVFVYSEKNAVERMLSFAARFIVMLYCKNAENIVDSLEDAEEEPEPEDPLIAGILGFLFKSHGAASADARLRVVTLFNKILSSMPENSTISDDFWSKLTETVLSRIQDKSPIVRAQAVLTARKLQNPKNADCEIMQALVFHLNDPSSAVRRVVVSSIALNKTTIGYVLGRTRDVNDNVRRNAYLVFSKVKVLNLTIKYRTTILDRGLSDRSEMVRECVRKLVVVHWLENFNNDIIKFLESLDVVNGSEIGILVLEAIFKTMPMSDILKHLPLVEETKLIPMDELTPETVLLWRCLVQHFHKEQLDDELELILPNLTVFCNFIKEYYPPEKNLDSDLSEDEQWEEIKKKQILLHLIHMAKVFDLSDEMGRLNLKKLIIALLASYRISASISDCLIELMALVVPSPDVFMQEITEVISEVREPLNQVDEPIPQHKKIELELKISDLKVTLNDLKEREYNAVQNKEYVEAQNLKDEIEDIASQIEELQSQPVTVPQELREERNDPVTVCKCLTMLIQMIKSSGVRSLTPTLRSLKDNFLNQCLTSHDLLTQSLAIQALGQFCILDKDLAKDNLFRFMLMINETGDNEINLPALKSIFDIVHMYGIESFENLDETQNLSNSRTKSRTLLIENENFLNESVQELQADGTLSGAKCISMLKELLNWKTNDGVKMLVYEGLCKLLLSGVVYSCSVLTKIIIKGFSPIIESESEDFIRQVFIVFFPIFASNTPRSQEMIESAFMPVMKIIANASLGSPEADISPKDVLTFLIEHTIPDINKFASKTLHVHNNLALSICNEILHDTFDETNMIVIFMKGLLQLDISYDESFVQQLKTLVTKLEEKLEDIPIVLRCVKDLNKRLDEKAQTTLQSVENTLATTNSDARTSKGTVNDTTNAARTSTETLDDVGNSTITTKATRNSSVSTVRTTRSSKRRRTVQDDLSAINETLESTQISESNDSFSTPGSTYSRKKGEIRTIVPESPEISDESS